MTRSNGRPRGERLRPRPASGKKAWHRGRGLACDVSGRLACVRTARTPNTEPPAGQAALASNWSLTKFGASYFGNSPHSITAPAISCVLRCNFIHN